MVRYVSTIAGISTGQIQGFFDGWPQPPSPDTHRRLLSDSDEIIVALDDDSGVVVGFITAITDRVLAAYIPFLEVLPEYRSQGVGSELVRRMLERLNGLYMVDLLCDEHLQPFMVRWVCGRPQG